jgi:NAD(P)-dependent dehydrogenase (short-subunit alcohol dehydrogenase family)
MASVLVTGASRGIGRSIVTHLAANGWDVIAAVRNEQDAAAITAADPQRISSVILDVTDPEQVGALDNSLPERLDAVVNNAGIVVGGPIEAVAPSELRRQFEVNVIGPVAVTQVVLPRLRRSHGRVLFISSINGKLAFPLIGAYCASKFAVEGAADALRMELKPWKIAVIVIEPAQTDTDIWRTADSLLDETAAAMTSEQRALYAKHMTGLRRSIPLSQRLAGPPEKVAAVVGEALTARRPRARYVVGIAPKLQLRLMANLPAAARDSILRKVSGQPGRA